ncbi:MAG TPA: FAD-dependent oxidoreductase [Streptosporangiaceae bacterium]|nr:FAD-dependent oxidoreductase [Streptosporangiaceae bacterium]
MSELPVVVIGAGPQGLAAAAHLLERGLDPLVLEAGPGPAHAVSEWGHVRLFSAWPELVDAAAARLLSAAGWTAPAAGYPTGAEWIAAYLRPLADALGGHVRYGARVTGVSRRGRGRLVDSGRASQPFTVHVTDASGRESRLDARAVIDASGTWTQPNPAGADGLPALGERAAAGALSYQVPDFAQTGAFAGKHTVVVGSGHSALTAITELARIARSHPGTLVSWVLRRPALGNSLGGGESDELPERGALGARVSQAVDAGLVSVQSGFRVEQIRRDGGGVVLVAEDGRALPPADRVVVLTGFRPDLSFLSEMRLELDATLQAPARIAVEIDPNVHSCGSVSATGAADLAHPEPDLYLVGMKSYGRAPTFLAMTGYEQVRSVVAELAGDHEAAARIELKLPDTGVCGGAGIFDDPETAGSGGCCGTPLAGPPAARIPVSA